MIIITLSSLNLSQYFSERRGVEKEQDTKILGKRDFLIEDQKYWQEFLKVNPNYFPGWCRLAEIDKQLGEKIETQRAYDRAFQINPNSKKCRSLKTEIGTKH